LSNLLKRCGEILQSTAVMKREIAKNPSRRVGSGGKPSFTDKFQAGGWPLRVNRKSAT
jgi:hypothetical protein